MPGKSSRLETIFWIETPDFRGEVLGGREDKTRIAGPLDTPNRIKMAR